MHITVLYSTIHHTVLYEAVDSDAMDQWLHLPGTPAPRPCSPAILEDEKILNQLKKERQQ